MSNGGSGDAPFRKILKSDPGVALAKKRVTFAKKHADKNAQAWKGFLQGVADLKDFTWYPRDLQARFKKYRAPWTYMTKKDCSRKSAGFAAPVSPLPFQIECD